MYIKNCGLHTCGLHGRLGGKSMATSAPHWRAGSFSHQKIPTSDIQRTSQQLFTRQTAMSFSSIPVLDISLARNSDTKPTFLESLRQALLQVGFLYIKNIGIDDGLIQDVIRQGKAFFDLPEEKRLEIQMKNTKSFLGWLL